MLESKNWVTNFIIIWNIICSEYSKIYDVYQESQKPDRYVYKGNELYKTTKNRADNIQSKLSQWKENKVSDISLENEVNSEEDGIYY